MLTKYQTMYDRFCEMFPTFKDHIVKYGTAKNGAGIVLMLDDRTELQFSYLDKKTWWLRTT